MNRAALESALRSAVSYEGWLRALASLFATHELHYGHGTASAEDDAYWLLGHVLEWREAAWQAAPDPGLIEAVVEIAARRVEQRSPLAYVLGEAWFAGLRFEIDSRVLIPRSPLAEIVERGFEPWCALAPGDRVLDIGTGSGCIAIAAAHYCPGVRVDATDVSAAALEVAAANAALHGLGERVRLVAADVYPPPGARYRVIISNPPYVPERELAELPAEYAHEPVAALAAGRQGLDVVERILRDAPRYLAPDGVLIVEIGGGQETFEARYPRLHVVWLTFERGGDGVFLVTRSELDRYERDTSG